ncbi:MAG TPA: hypothetical protein VGZ47_20415 [Gemmataceae bacterium]|nr:hypothetical protein [Gemmataceae bacterium]
MLRKFIAAAVVVVLSVGVAAAKDKAVTGKIKKIDGSTLTVTTGKKGMTEDKEYKIGDSVKFVFVQGDDKKEMAAKDALKSDQLKEGAGVKLTLNDKGEVTEVEVLGKKAK